MTIRSDLRHAQAAMTVSPTQGVLACMTILGRFPGNPAARRMLRNMDKSQRQHVLRDATRLCDAGHWAEALQVLAPLGTAHPTDPRLALTAAWCLFHLGRPAAMAERLEAPVTAHPDHPGLRAALGTALQAKGSGETALTHLAAAAALAPRDAQIANNLGLVQVSLGKFDAARASFLTALAEDGCLIEVWPNLAPLVDFRNEPELLSRLEAICRRADISPAQQELAAFARSKAAFDLGDTAAAFHWLDRANALHRAAHPHDEAAVRARVMTVTDGLPQEISVPPPGTTGARIVMVVGMPRSGTTLVERILDAHPQVEGLGECRDLDRIVAQGDRAADWTVSGLTELGAAYRSALARHASRTRPIVVDKMPSNALSAGLALAALPDLHVIHVRRDPVATALSNYRTRYSNGNDFAYDLNDIAARQMLTDRMMRRWRRRFAGRVHDVVLEALIERPGQQISRLLDRLGLPAAGPCLNFTGAHGAIHTASQYQVRGPVARQPSADWHPLAPFIGGLLDSLQPAISEHGRALATARSAV